MILAKEQIEVSIAVDVPPRNQLDGALLRNVDVGAAVRKASPTEVFKPVVPNDLVFRPACTGGEHESRENEDSGLHDESPHMTFIYPCTCNQLSLMARPHFIASRTALPNSGRGRLRQSDVDIGGAEPENRVTVAADLFQPLPPQSRQHDAECTGSCCRLRTRP